MACIKGGVFPQTGRLTDCTKPSLVGIDTIFLRISAIAQMNSASVALLLFLISLFIRRGDAAPNECYTCQSLVDSPVCGEGYRSDTFLTKYCMANQVYCLKIIETAGRKPIIYRKCSSLNCEQEVALREGSINKCSVCTTSLCNEGSLIGPSISPLLVLSIFLYQVPTINLFEHCC